MAYVIVKKETPNLPYLPLEATLKTGKEITFRKYDATIDEEQLYEIVKFCIDEGDSYPQWNLDNIEDFRGFYTSHDVFVMIDRKSSQVMAAFYVKPNFPGRSSHICNGGFVVKASCRRSGLGEFMVQQFLRVAPDLGYKAPFRTTAPFHYRGPRKASFFNLVYANNVGSIRLWEKYGFVKTGIVPKGGNLKNLGYVDAYQYYYDFEKAKQ